MTATSAPVQAAVPARPATPARLRTVLDPRLTRLRAGLARAGAEAILLSSPAHTYYVTGSTRPREVLVTGGDVVLDAAVPDALAGIRGPVLMEAGHLTAARYQVLAAGPQRSWRDGTDLLLRLRAVKDALEVAVLTRAARISVAAMTEAAGAVEVGVTELDLEGLLWRGIRSRGADGWAYDPSVAGGPRAAQPWHGVTTRALTDGDTLVIDAGARVRQYRADLTRTFLVGTPDTEARRAFDAVRRARDAAFGRLYPGVPAAEIAAVVIDTLAGSGWTLPHAAGHGLGLALHERPFLTRRSTDLLLPGTVFTIEPGVYRAGWGGVRLEDTVVVGEDGWTLLTGDAEHR